MRELGYVFLYTYRYPRLASLVRGHMKCTPWRRLEREGSV